jgi:transcriptional regulator with XRE-family HTH domain
VSDDVSTFGARLRACRRRAGLSQDELAGRSGLSVRAISDLERGRTRRPYPNTCLRLADALELGETARAEFLAAGRGPGQPEIVAGVHHPADEAAQARAPGSVPPRHLPAPVPAFVGRQPELAALLDLGRYRQAADHHQRAITLFRHGHDRSGEAEACDGLGEVSLALGRPELALVQHAAARDLAGQAGSLDEQARAHHGLACAFQAAGRVDQAQHSFEEAIRLYARLGAPEADQIRARLSSADGNGSARQ